MIGEAALGIFTNLLTFGFKRSVSLTFQKIARLKKIDLATRAKSTKNPLVQQALADFEIVIGTYQGQLTTRLDQFLKELEKTGLLEGMVENALVSRSSNELETMFCKLHSQFFDQEVSGKNLYKKMMQAFTVTVKELSKDTVLFSLVSATRQDLMHRLDRLDESLAPLHSIAKTLDPDDEADSEVLLKIVSGLQNSYRNVRVETNRGPRNVEINRVYVPAKLAIRQNPGARKVDNAISKILHDASEERYVYINGSVERDKNHSLTFMELTSSFRRAVVLGDPGGGKSTLCQKLCYDHCKSLSLSLKFDDEERLKSKELKLPIRIVLRQFEQARTQAPQLDILSYVCNDIVHYAGSDAKDIRRVIKAHLATGKIILAFDGLDEILDTSKRQEFVDLVAAFSNQYPLCPTIVTSRLVGYDDAPLPDEFDEVSLQKFDNDEVELFLVKFMKVVGGRNAQEAKKAAQKFLEQTTNTAEDLRKNPLMLGLMGWLFLASGDVPSNRPEIYRECSVLMFERWDQNRGINADEMNDFDRSQLFISLASQIYGKPDLSAGVTKKWLEASLNKSFSDLFADKARARRSAKNFVKFITGRAWVMTEVGDDVYAFTHQTFLEYFFAKYLDDKHDTVKGLLKALKGKIIKREWNEVSHLALQIKTDRSLRKQEEAAVVLENYIVSSRLERQQIALMSFGARALEYLAPSEQKLATFINSVCEADARRATSGKVRLFSFAAAASHISSIRSDFIRETIIDYMLVTMRSSSPAKVEFVGEILRHRNESPYRSREYIEDFGLSLGVRAKAMEKLRPEVEKLAKTSKIFAGYEWGFYGVMDLDKVEKYGVSIIYNNPLPIIGNINGLFTLAYSPSLGPTALPAKFNKKDIIRSLEWMSQNIDAIIPADLSDFNPDFQLQAPNHVWEDIYLVLEPNPRALFGAMVCRVFSTNGRLKRAHESRRQQGDRNKGLKNLVKKELELIEQLQSDPTCNDINFGLLENMIAEGRSAFTN